MQEILTIAQTISPLGIIALLVIVVFQLVNGKGLLTKIKGTQSEKYPALEEHLTVMAQLVEQNKTLLENHFQHEIPQMMDSIEDIKEKLDVVIQKYESVNDRVIVLETLNKERERSNKSKK